MYRPPEYEENIAFSQTDFKLFEESITSFYDQVIMKIKMKERRSTAFDVGDLTEVFLAQRSLKDNYYVIRDNKAEPGMRKLCNALLKIVKTEHAYNLKDDGPIDLNVMMYMGHFIDAAMASFYYYNPAKAKPWSRTEDTIINDIKTTGADYFRELVQGEGKIQVDYASWSEAEKCERNVRQTPDEDIRALMNTIDNPPAHIEVFRGLPIYGECAGLAVKILPDIMIKDNNLMTIDPWDFKTCDSLSNFMRMYWEKHYLRQGALYSYIIQRSYAMYNVSDFRFLAIPKGSEFPEIYEMHSSEVSAALNGGTFASGKKYRGIRDICDDITWHLENNLWDHRRKYYENGKKNLLYNFPAVNRTHEPKEYSDGLF